MRETANKNRVLTSLIGQGYHGTIMPPVIQRNILENPAWYTAYTPYQAEIAQGRLEALLNFQTMVSDLTGLDVANASLLDEATAAAEAMSMAHAIVGDDKRTKFLIAENCHPQTIAVVMTRAESMGFYCVVAKIADMNWSEDCFGVLFQYPATDGTIADYTQFCAKAKSIGAISIAATDLLALTLLKPPGELARISPSDRASVSACRWVSAVRTRRFWRREMSTRCPAGWWAFPRTCMGMSRIAWRYRLASSTSAASARPATSAPPRCCRPSLPRCMHDEAQRHGRDAAHHLAGVR